MNMNPGFAALLLPQTCYEAVDLSGLPHEVFDVGDSAITPWNDAWFTSEMLGDLRWVLGQPGDERLLVAARQRYSEVLFQRRLALEDGESMIDTSSCWLSGRDVELDWDEQDLDWGDEVASVCFDDVLFAEEETGVIAWLPDRGTHVLIEAAPEYQREIEDRIHGVSDGVDYLSFSSRPSLQNLAETWVSAWLGAERLDPGTPTRLPSPGDGGVQFPDTSACCVHALSDEEVLVLSGAFYIALSREFAQFWNTWQRHRVATLARHLEGLLAVGWMPRGLGNGPVRPLHQVVWGNWDRWLVARASRMALATGRVGGFQANTLTNMVRRCVT